MNAIGVMVTHNTHTNFQRQEPYARTHLIMTIRGRINPRMQIVPILEKIQQQTGWNQSELAKRLKVTQPTVSRWYKGSKPDLEQRDGILVLAKKLGIVPDARDFGDTMVPIVGFVGAGGTIVYSEGQGPFGEAQMPPKNGTETTVAVVVRGDSMAGQLEDGWLVYYDNRRSAPTEELVGRLCVVGLTDGRILIKKLLPGRQNGKYDLYSTNAAPMLDQQIDWAAKVTWIAPV